METDREPPSLLGNSTRERSSSRAPSNRRMQTNDSEKAGRVWAREPEEDPWAPCILTLDGGGIRGYSSLLILKDLMHHIWQWETKLDEEEQFAATQYLSPTELQHNDSQTTTSTVDRPVDVESDEAAKDMEGKYGVDVNIDNVVDEPRSAHAHTQQDHLTANISARKALVEEELLPCHYFDFMYGTSTGGLIATMLGRLRMSVAEGLELYRSVGDTLFGRKRSSIPLMTKYYHEPLEKAVRDIVKSRCRDHSPCDGNDLFPWLADGTLSSEAGSIIFDPDQPRVCQACCLTATNDKHISEAHLLRSYNHVYSENTPNWITDYNQGADMMPIWEVTRATTAAPFYFDKLNTVIDGTPVSFKDGGIRENNPSGAALSEFHALYEGKFEQPALLLSVGTGRPDMSADGFATHNSLPGFLGRIGFINKQLDKAFDKGAVLRNVLIKYTEGEHQHLQMREHARGEHTWYKRLNVSDGLGGVPLDDWVKGDWREQRNVPGGETLTRMENATALYLERDYDPEIDSYAPPSVMIRQAAQKLVRQRRAREKGDKLRWDVFVGRTRETR